MDVKKKKNFVKPKLIKFDKPLDKVTLCSCGSPPSCRRRRRPPGGVPDDFVAVSRAHYKQDIHYLDPNERAAYAQEVLNFKLATYRYKTDGDRGRMNLGFIIDDVEPSVSVNADLDRVDLYGFTSMAVAALQDQAATIDVLKRELETLKGSLEDLTRKKK